MKKPTPQEREQLRVANPKGMPRVDYREMTLVVQKREAAEGEAENLVEIAISSEQPVLRYDWWDDEFYHEVLGHAKDEVDLSYSRDGLPFVMSHRAYDGDMQHGLVENIRLEDNVLRGDVRFSRAERSQEIRQDMMDGIRKKVSVGYIVGDEYEQTAGKGKDGIPTRRYKAWMPMEVSTVPIPADYSVGVGRANSASGQAALARFLELHPQSAGQRSQQSTPPKGKDGNMPEGDAPEGGKNTVDAKVVRDEGVQAERGRVKDITQLARDHKCEEKLSEWLNAGKTTDEVTREINSILSARLKAPTTSNVVELSPKDAKRFSYARAMLLDPDTQRVARGEGLGAIDTGLEREVMEEARKRSPNIGKGGLFIPFVATQGRANVDSSSTVAGAFKFTQPGEFIDILRNKTSVLRAGARFLPGLTGPVGFPKKNATATAAWVAENPGSDASRSNMTATTVSLALKTVLAATAVSRQALIGAASGNYDLEQIIRDDLAAVIALAIDLGALNGLGSSNQPLGVLQDTSVGTATALGTAGGTMAWSNWVELETAIAIANGDVSALAYLTNAKQRSIAKRTSPLAATASGIPIWSGNLMATNQMDGGQLPGDGMVNGYRAIASNQVPSNLTKGSNTTVCSAIVFGAFDQLIIGQFGAGFEILADPYTLKLQGLIDLTAWAFLDVANRQPTAFATIKDALG